MRVCDGLFDVFSGGNKFLTSDKGLKLSPDGLLQEQTESSVKHVKNYWSHKTERKTQTKKKNGNC